MSPLEFRVFDSMQFCFQGGNGLATFMVRRPPSLKLRCCTPISDFGQMS